MLALVAFAGSYHTYNSSSAVEESYLLMANVEALAGNGEISPEEKIRMEECYAKEGNWDMASTCKASGFEDIECSVSREVSIFGVTLKGSYTKGKSYSIAWARYECIGSKGNCCKKQGLFSGDEQLA